MKQRWLEKNGEVLDLPKLTALIEKEREGCYVSHCPELGVSSQGKSRSEAYGMLQEAVELWLECATSAEIKRRLKAGATVRSLELTNA